MTRSKKLKVILASTTAAIIVTVVLILPLLNPCAAYLKNFELPNSYPARLWELGRIVPTVDDANRLTGLDLQVPAQLPDDLELKKVILVSDDPATQKVVSMVYLPKRIQINENSTDKDILVRYEGVLVTYIWYNPPYAKTESIDEIGSVTNAERVTVGGKDSVIFDRVPQSGGLAKVIFYNDDVQVSIQSCARQKEDLLKIAASINSENNASAGISVNRVNLEGLSSSLNVKPMTITSQQLASHPELEKIILEVDKRYLSGQPNPESFEGTITMNQAKALLNEFSFIETTERTQGHKSYLAVLTVNNENYAVLLTFT